MPKRQEILFRQIVVACDVATLVLSCGAAYWIRDDLLRSWYGALFPFSEYTWLLLIVVPTWILLLQSLGLYNSALYESPPGILIALFKVQLLGGLILLSILFLSKSGEISRLFLLSFLGGSFFALFGERVGMKMVLSHLRRRQSPHTRKVLVVGADSRAERYLRLLHDRPHWGAQVMGFLSSNGNGRQSSQFCGKPVLGQPVDLPSVLKEHVVDEVVVPGGEGIDMERLAMACVERGITLRRLVEIPDVQVGSYNAEELARGLYMLSVEMTPQRTSSLLVKRLVDIIGATAGLFLCALAYLWYWPKIRGESQGPVIFHQTRVGENGRLFTLHKFRTMYADAENQLQDLSAVNEMKGSIFKMSSDPRVTPTGGVLRYRHIDEFPQFWNVLRGEMSLVGTRPPTPAEVAQYLPRHYRRISMKSGITGLWQLQGNGTVNNFEDIVRLDCEYIDNWSLWLDCKILAKTVVKVMRGGGW